MIDYKNPSFRAFPLETGMHFDDSKSEFPSKVHSFDLKGTESHQLKNEKSSFYIYVHAGPTVLTRMLKNQIQTIVLLTGQYACVEQDVMVTGGKGIIIEKLNHKVMFMMGGPIEEIGRLNYIDGCTDSLLIPPVIKGDSCFNHLHFPAGIDQTPHTHPSIRTGLIARGSGWCITPWGSIPLKAGDVFLILPDQRDEKGKQKTIKFEGITQIIGTHSFRTDKDTMDVIAYHPDSDFGPEHQFHPMINRTIVDGVSASDLEDVQSHVI